VTEHETLGRVVDGVVDVGTCVVVVGGRVVVVVLVVVVLVVVVSGGGSVVVVVVVVVVGGRVVVGTTVVVVVVGGCWLSEHEIVGVIDVLVPLITLAHETTWVNPGGMPRIHDSVGVIVARFPDTATLDDRDSNACPDGRTTVMVQLSRTVDVLFVMLTLSP
jgi:hypothetical protein